MAKSQRDPSLAERNEAILELWLEGQTAKAVARQFFVSAESVRRILFQPLYDVAELRKERESRERIYPHTLEQYRSVLKLWWVSESVRRKLSGGADPIEQALNGLDGKCSS